MDPRNGRIQVGADADIALVDLDREWTVDAARLGSAPDFSLYDGWTLRGWPVLTLARGRVAARDHAVLGKPGEGRFVAR